MNILGFEVKNKYVLIGGVVFLASSIAYIIWRRKKATEIFDELSAQLENTTKGAAKNLNIGYSTTSSGKAIYWTSPTYWVGKTKMTDTTADSIAKNISWAIDNKISYLRSAKSQVDSFKVIKNQAEASKILGAYTKKGYGSMLFDIKALKPETQKQITDYLNNLPLK